MADSPDFVAHYARSEGLEIRPRTIFVEGVSDAALCTQAAEFEWQRTGSSLIGEDLAVVAAGNGPRGGSQGVVRRLIALREMARTCLLPNGLPRYRFIALLDNDDPGRVATNLAQNIDTSILEYKDVFRLRPVMPIPRSMDPTTVRRAFEEANAPYNNLNWELEDLLGPRLLERFFAEHPKALKHKRTVDAKTHWELTRDGKTLLHRYVTEKASHDDLVEVVQLLRTFRGYFGLPHR